MKTCHWCKQPLQFVRGRGWVHLEGGVYAMRCRDCGWQGAPHPSPTTCPQCGSKEVRDEHAALPEADEDAPWGFCCECGGALTGPVEQLAQTCIPCAETLTTKRDMAALRAVIERQRPRTAEPYMVLRISREDVRFALGLATLDISDADMEDIAYRVACAFFENGGWDIIAGVAREVLQANLGLPPADLDLTMRYRPPGHGVVAYCRVRIYRRPDGMAVVIITELPDNPGMSVTNAIEYIAGLVAEQCELDPRTTTWVEHYPDRHPSGLEHDHIFDETWDVVEFGIDKHGDAWRFVSPRWQHSTRDEVMRLIAACKPAATGWAADDLPPDWYLEQDYEDRFGYPDDF